MLKSDYKCTFQTAAALFSDKVLSWAACHVKIQSKNHSSWEKMLNWLIAAKHLLDANSIKQFLWLRHSVAEQK